MSCCWERTFLKMASMFQALTSEFSGEHTPILQTTERGFFMDDCMFAFQIIKVS